MRSSHLKSHILCHTGEKPHECTICSKRFIKSSDLERHIRYHTGEKPYECMLCGKKCTESGTLKKHMRLHAVDGAKSFHECTVCGKKYTELGTLKKHMRKHVVGGEKSYECSHCGQTFAEMSFLKTHVDCNCSKKQCADSCKISDVGSLEMQTGVSEDQLSASLLFNSASTDLGASPVECKVEFEDNMASSVEKAVNQGKESLPFSGVYTLFKLSFFFGVFLTFLLPEKDVIDD